MEHEINGGRKIALKLRETPGRIKELQGIIEKGTRNGKYSIGAPAVPEQLEEAELLLVDLENYRDRINNTLATHAALDGSVGVTLELEDILKREREEEDEETEGSTICIHCFTMDI